MLTFHVTATLNGVLLAEDYLGGIESDAGDEYFDEIFEEMIANCNAQVDRNVEQLEKELDTLKKQRALFKQAQKDSAPTKPKKFQKCPRCHKRVENVREHYTKHPSYQEMKEKQQAHNDRVRTRVVQKARRIKKRKSLFVLGEKFDIEKHLKES
jgi:hypothetical protein